MKTLNQKLSRSVFCLTIVLAGQTIRAQTAVTPPSATSTNATATNTTQLGTVTVVGHLNQAREQIVPSLGGTKYEITASQIQDIPQGADAPFSQILLRTPGMAEDSLGQVHLRGEHANIQYRIDDILLPEGITGFGSELDPHFVQSMSLLTGSLPAEYGYRTAGIVDIQTKAGFENAGQVSVYGGSYDTIIPSFEYGGTEGKFNYFVSGSYDHNDIGVENPTPSSVPIHDYTDQYRTFMYGSYIIDDSSRLTMIASVDDSDYEIPINPKQPLTLQTNGDPWPGVPGTLPATALNDNQHEQNYYAVLGYQKSAGNLNFQVAAYARESGAHYVPDDVDATLDYNNGIATDEDRKLYSGGVQGDASYTLGDSHTLRAGLMLLDESVSADTTTTVMTNEVPANKIINIVQDGATHAVFGGLYLQDEWKIVPKLTLNYGTRFDVYSSSTDDENQISPRANLIYQPVKTTSLHIGYSRYFTPPPLETVPTSELAAFNNTSGQQAVTYGSPVKAERANYYDAGITHELLPGLTLGVDGYYKTAQNQLDDGFFGQSLILSSFNYNQGRVRGVEFTANYTHGGFSTYANVAYSVAQGRGAGTAQFLWPDQTTVNYVNNHWVYLDHDQRVTGSFGADYTWKESGRSATRFFVDALYGSGLRQDGPDDIPGSADLIPNGSSVGAYYTLGTGVEEGIKFSGKERLILRVDVVNVTDNVYPLRTGSGVGVNAAQYGERRGLFGSLTYAF
ncbi:MAG TPA: TonB-dependent receptor [Candidatus Baltobacteraceae bacterium]|jgi:outer membrane receptor protein involved in Fe transport|nr:TonB-dependent receptor [Candidatus Baltobacteraceae bacterium]